MPDDLRVFGLPYEAVMGVKMTDSEGNEVTYSLGGGEAGEVSQDREGYIILSDAAGGGSWTADVVASATGMSGEIEFESDVTTARQNAFHGATALTGVVTKYNVVFSSGMFYGCSGLERACFSNNDANFNSADIFNNCSALKIVDWGFCNMSIGADSFRATDLEVLILRKTSVASLGGGGVNVFRGCTNIQENGNGVTIYIPKTLYDSLGSGTASDYKAATNWSIIDGYGTITWEQLEGSPYESTTWWED